MQKLRIVDEGWARKSRPPIEAALAKIAAEAEALAKRKAEAEALARQKAEAESLAVKKLAEAAAAAPKLPAPGMISIPGGTFTMGSPESENDRGIDEIQHSVTVSAFYMGLYEVTQAEWVAVMGSNPSNFKGNKLPVEKVSWYDILVFCNKLSIKEGKSPSYSINGSTDPGTWGVVPERNDSVWNKASCNFNVNGYRLPTEAEWEYACRAGTTTPFGIGENVTTAQANYNGNYPYNGNTKGEYRQKTLLVGSLSSNAFGLYDMHGNVWEWCWDWYGNYASGTQNNPLGASLSGVRVNRGGSWNNNSQYLRSATRGNITPGNKGYNLGFRLVCRP